MSEWLPAVVAVVGAAGAGASAWFAATRSQRKQPEDRQQVIAETAELVVTMLRDELKDCLERREELERSVGRLEGDQEELRQRVAALEAEVRRLDPSSPLLQEG